jgi:integrase
MKRAKTAKNVSKPAADFQKVFDEKNRRVRGLWLRDGIFYAQMNPSGLKQQYKYRLQDAKTVPQAMTAAQALKAAQKKGELLSPSLQRRQYTTNTENGMTLHDAIESYKTHRDKLGQFDPRTCSRQDNSLNSWETRCGKLQLKQLDNLVRVDFAEWRRTKPGGKVVGRTIDNDVSALNHVIEHAIEDLKWLKADPFTAWHALDRGPTRKIRLLEHDELHVLCKLAFLPEIEMDKQNWPEQYRNYIRRANQYFADYLYVLAFTGARERESTMLKWSYVNWKKKTVLFPGSNAKDGAGVPAEDREVDFNSHLEAHLTEMYARRDPDSDYMFPDGHGGHVKSFRKQLNRVREHQGFGDIGFHHTRHYFISYAVMSQPYIDLATIARWVGHRDNGALIMRKYLKLRSEHTQKMGQQLNLGPVKKQETEPISAAIYDI